MYYITTSRPYTNSYPHLGTAVDSIFADVFARFQRRLKDGAVYYSTGTDEHSFKIVDKAKELGISPKEFVDQKYQEFTDFYKKLNISSDGFFQNSVKEHHNLSNLVWNQIQNSGYLYKKSYTGLYCKGCEDFYSESQLLNDRCPIHQHMEMVQVQEENYFFKLSKFKDRLLKYLRDEVSVPDKSVLKEMINFVEDLQDISVSRDRSRLSIDWGVPVYSDPEHVMYVWFEALLTYLTPIVEDENISDWEVFSQNPEKVFNQLKRFLPQDLMVIGRDNAKFHLIILPAILASLDLPLPKVCLVHGMITDELGRKFAKSLGNGVDINDLRELIGDEGIRYFVLREVNPIGDTAFSMTRLVESYNSTLANNIGNLLVRITNMIEKSLDGFIDYEKYDIANIVDFENVYKNIDAFSPKNAFAQLVSQYTAINQYIDEEKPWKLDDKQKIAEVLGKALKSYIAANEVLSIFLPDSAERIKNILNTPQITKAPVIFERVEI